MLENEYKTELRSITKNAGITAFGIFFMNVLAFATNAIITRTLGAESYGLFVLATRIIDFIAVVSALGFTATIVRFVSFYKGKGDFARAKGTILYAAGILFLTTLFTSTLLFFLSNVISINIFDRKDLILPLKILIISLPFTVSAGALLSSLIGLKLIKQNVLVSRIFNPIAYLTLASVCFLLGYRLLGLITVQVITAILIFILTLLLVYKKFLVHYKNVKPLVEKKKLWNFSWPLFFNQLFLKALNFSPIFIMGLYLSTTDIGIFNISFRIALMVSILLSAFRLIFSPTISGLFARQNKKLIGQLYKATTKWIFTFSLMVFSIVVLYGETLLRVFGNEFQTGVLVLLILSVGELVSASAGLVGNIIIMSGRPKVSLTNSGLTLILVLILCLKLVPEYGIVGAAIAYATSIILVNILRISEVFYFERMHPFNFSFLKPVIAAAFSFILVYSFNDVFNFKIYLKMVVGSILFLCIFCMSIWILRLDSEDKYILGIIFSRFKQKSE